MRRFTLILTLATLFIAASCTTESCKKYVTKDPIKHVIIVGFDGFSGYSVDNGVDMPFYRKLMSEGAYTTKARTVLPSSSACNWASIFMGASPELHGYTTWGSQTPDLPSRVVTENGIFPNIYSEYRKASPEAQLDYIYEWGGMRYLVDTLSVNTLDFGNEEECMNKAIKAIKNDKPELLSVIFAEPDGKGHSIGWESKEYMDKMSELDSRLAKIVGALEEAGILDETLLIVCSDHGGVDTGHGGKSMKEMQSPLLLWGKGVKKGHEIMQSVMLYDIASTVLSSVHVDQPQVWIGRPIIEAFE